MGRRLPLLTVRLCVPSVPVLQHHGGEAEARAEVFRLKCKEQREQMGILKRDLKQAKKSLKTMELLAAMGKENKERNAQASEPQVGLSPFVFILGLLAPFCCDLLSTPCFVHTPCACV